MSTPALIVVLTVVLFTALTIALVVVVSMRQLRALLRGLGALQTQVVPQLALLADEAAAAQAQIEAMVRARDEAVEDDVIGGGDGGDAWSQGYTGVPQQPTAGTRHA